MHRSSCPVNHFFIFINYINEWNIATIFNLLLKKITGFGAPVPVWDFSGYCFVETQVTGHAICTHTLKLINQKCWEKIDCQKGFTLFKQPEIVVCSLLRGPLCFEYTGVLYNYNLLIKFFSKSFDHPWNSLQTTFQPTALVSWSIALSLNDAGYSKQSMNLLARQWLRH